MKFFGSLRALYKTQRPLLLLALLINLSCSKKAQIPDILVGKWVFDTNKSHEVIMASTLTDKQKKDLEINFLNLAKGQKKNISPQGNIMMPGITDVVKLTMEVVKIDGDKIYTRVNNSMNPDHYEYSLNYINGDSWRAIEVDKNLQPLNRAPDNYWKKLN